MNMERKTSGTVGGKHWTRVFVLHMHTSKWNHAQECIKSYCNLPIKSLLYKTAVLQ